MQVQAVFTERLAVVGHIDHGRVVMRLRAVQKIHDARQEIVGIEQRVVIGIHDFLLRAMPQVVALAGRDKTLEDAGIAPVVRRAMAAELVHHHKQVARRVARDAFHAMQQHLVQALAFEAQRRHLCMVELLG